jgi:putative addiction module component (TIGR02574 family)
MNPIPIPVPPGFSELSKAEQIEYVQALWDMIAERDDDLPVPEEHLEEVERRLAEHRLHPEDVLPAYDVLERLRRSLE